MSTSSFSSIEKLSSKISELIIMSLNNIVSSSLIQSELSLIELQTLIRKDSLRMLLSKSQIIFDNKNILFGDIMYELSTKNEDKFNLMLILTDNQFLKYLIAVDVVSNIKLDKTICINFNEIVSMVYKMELNNDN